MSAHSSSVIIDCVQQIGHGYKECTHTQIIQHMRPMITMVKYGSKTFIPLKDNNPNDSSAK